MCSHQRQFPRLTCFIYASAFQRIAWLFELAGGAVADATDTCLPKEQREATFTIAAFHQWELDDDDPACVETAEHVRHRRPKSPYFRISTARILL